MICPRCGADNPETAAYCGLCMAGLQGQGISRSAGTEPPIREDTESRAPENVVPPGPQLPPGALQVTPHGPPVNASGGVVPAPSDAFGYTQIPPAGPVPAAVGPSRKKSRLVWVIGIVAVAVTAAVGWFGMDYILSRPKTFTSGNGSYSFTYPGKWKKADSSAFALAGLSTSGVNTEVALADSSAEDPNHVFFSGTTVAPGDWATIKARLLETYSKGISGSMPPGVSVSSPTFKDVEIGGKPGLSIRFTLTYQKMTYDCDMTVVQNGISVQIILMMAKKPGASLDEFQEILKSIKYKS